MICTAASAPAVLGPMPRNLRTDADWTDVRTVDDGVRRRKLIVIVFLGVALPLTAGTEEFFLRCLILVFDGPAACATNLDNALASSIATWALYFFLNNA